MLSRLSYCKYLYHYLHIRIVYFLTKTIGVKWINLFLNNVHINGNINTDSGAIGNNGGYLQGDRFIRRWSTTTEDTVNFDEIGRYGNEGVPFEGVTGREPHTPDPHGKTIEKNLCKYSKYSP